jgi:hypothetical protein
MISQVQTVTLTSSTMTTTVVVSAFLPSGAAVIEFCVQGKALAGCCNVRCTRARTQRLTCNATCFMVKIRALFWTTSRHNATILAQSHSAGHFYVASM